MDNKNKTCKNRGHRAGGMEFGKCMLSGYYCQTERKNPSNCGKNFEGWIERPKRIGIFKWIKQLFYGE